MTTKPDTSTTRRQLLRTSGAALTAVGTAGLASTTASAQSDGDSQGILADGFEVEPDRSAFLKGYVAGIADRFSGYDDPATLADRMRNEFNANTDAWLRYGNWLLEEADVTAAGSATVGVDIGISRIPFNEPEDVVETHINAEYDDGAEEFVDLEWLDSAVDEPDFQVGLRNQAAQNGADDLSEFRRRYIGKSEADHEIPDDKYLNDLAGKYSSTLRIGEDSQTVLNVLLGRSL